MSEPTRVFISYAWRDGAPVAEWLYRRFNALEDWSAWMDLELHADTLFSHELQRRLDEAQVVVVVVSPDVNRRDTPSFVLKELQYATDPHINKPVFAARAADCQLPLIIQGWTYTDFLAANQYETAFAALVDKIKSGKTAHRAETQRERELAYLRGVAREHGFWGKVYVDVAAQTRRKAAPEAEQVVVTDAEVAAFLGEIALAVYPDKRHHPDDDTQAQRVENFAALSEALAQFEQVAIIGDPGCGKTTTLRRLAYDLAETAAVDETAPLPLYVPLGGYDGSDVTLYLERFFGGLRLRDYLPQRVVLLLDGLNEMPREQVSPVQQWLTSHPSVRVLLTCRKLDYVERKLAMQRIDVLPLDAPRIQQFMLAYKLSEAACDRLFWGLVRQPHLESAWRKWQTAGLTWAAFWQAEQPLESGHPVYAKTSGDQDRAYNTMRAALRERDVYPGLLGLVRNPFLLTITIAIYHATQAVPRNRAQLFAGFVQQLFEQRGKTAADRQKLVWIDDAVQRQALARLAYRMQAEHKGTRVEYAWARGVVAEAAPTDDPDRVLYLAASAGVIETGSEVRFVHQLLQEYFAAYGMGEDLRRGVAASQYFPGDRWWKATGWEETALLLAEMERTPEAVVQWLTPVQPILAYRCVTESETAVQESVLLPLLYPAEGARRCAIACAEGGRRWAERGDTRPGVGLRPDGLPDIEWVNIPAGTFLMGSDKAKDTLAQDKETPQQEVTLPAYRIARYPVTYAQFQAFLDAPDGFYNPLWWNGLADEQHRRALGEQAFQFSNHPRETVSWYDAIAYCRWLSAKLEYEVTLPTEAQWEKAARGTDGRVFPYGDDYDPAKANTRNTGIGQTSAVGIFPDGASPYGVLDMSGNVWEWCLTQWRRSYTEAEDNDLGGASARVVRGGSFRFNQYLARAASRLSYPPALRHSGIGFRLVCRPPSP